MTPPEIFLLGMVVGGGIIFLLALDDIGRERKETKLWKRRWLQEFDKNAELLRRNSQAKQDRDSADWWKDWRN